MPALSSALCPLLSDALVEAFRRYRVTTVAEFLSKDVVDLSQLSDTPCELLTAIRDHLLYQCAPHPTSAADLWRDMQDRAVVTPTAVKLDDAAPNGGCSGIDRLLGGGVMGGEVLEVTGQAASGKTQLCLTLMANFVMTTPTMVPSPTVAVVDGGGGFTATRLEEVMVERGAREEDIPHLLDRVRVYRVLSVYELLNLLLSLEEMTAAEVDVFHSSLKLLVVDCLTLFLSPHLGGRQFTGHALMCRVATTLKQLAGESAIAVVYTHNVVADFGSRPYGVKPALGPSWSNVPHSRLTLSPPHTSHPHTAHTHTAVLSKSQHQQCGISCAFTVTSKGLLG